MDEKHDGWSSAPPQDPQTLIDDRAPIPSPAPPSSPPPTTEDYNPKSPSPDPNPPPQSQSLPITTTTTTTTSASTTDDSDEDEPSIHKKQKTLSSLIPDVPAPSSPPITTPAGPSPPLPGSKKSNKKKNNNNVWTKSTSRKGKKKSKPTTTRNGSGALENTVHITPITRYPDRSDDSPDAAICLSRVYKAEKVELSDDRLSAGSSKGYRMVRATRGVNEGAWYFEIKVVKLGETGHARLGWTTDKGDLQAPVGYEANSYGYRDMDGSKVHKSLREKYGEKGYFEGDVIGFYINLPDGSLYAPMPPRFVCYKGQRCIYPADSKDEPIKTVPGSELSFFKNGVCQGVAFSNLLGGRYYPAASMYTLPNQPNCEMRFNFGPDFDFFPQDFGSRPTPRPMIEVPYLVYDSQVESPAEIGIAEKNN